MVIPDHYAEIIQNKGFADLNPILFGHDRCAPNQFMNAPIREYFLVHYVISGKGRLRVKDTWYTVSAQQIFIISEGTGNYYEADAEDPWEYIWLSFDGKLAEHFTMLPPVMNFPNNLFFEMLEVRNLDAMREEFLTEKLFALYRILFAKHVPNNYSAAIKNFIKINYMKPSISVDQIAKSLNLNHSYLARLFKKESKCSIQEYLIRTRIARAIELLEKKCSIQQVSSAVGYTDASTFSKIFKKYVGVSPQKYQQQTVNGTLDGEE